MTDAQLIAAAVAGDRRCFAALVSRYQAVSWSVALSVTGDPALSEDLAQEAFVIVWRRLGGLADRDRFAPWLCAIVRNVARSTRRHQRRHAPAAIELGDRLPQLASDMPSPLDQAMARESLARAWDALARLPARHREALLLYWNLELSHSMVAASLGITEETVRQRLSRARRELRAQIEHIERAVEGARHRRRAGVVATVLAAIAAPASARAAAPALISSLAAVAVVCAVVIVIAAASWRQQAAAAGVPAGIASRQPAAAAPISAPAAVSDPAPEPAAVSEPGPVSEPDRHPGSVPVARRVRGHVRHGPAVLRHGRPSISLRDLGDLAP